MRYRGDYVSASPVRPGSGVKVQHRLHKYVQKIIIHNPNLDSGDDSGRNPTRTPIVGVDTRIILFYDDFGR